MEYKNRHSANETRRMADKRVKEKERCRGGKCVGRHRTTFFERSLQARRHFDFEIKNT